MTPDEELTDIFRLRVVDLKKELTARYLSTKGRKAELIDRLGEYLDKAKSSASTKPHGDPASEPKSTKMEVAYANAKKTDSAPEAESKKLGKKTDLAPVELKAEAASKMEEILRSKETEKAIKEVGKNLGAKQAGGASEPSSKVAADESEAPRRTSSVLDMLGEEDDEDVEVPQQKDETKSQKPAEKAAKKSSGKVSKRDDARKPMDSEENSQEKRKKIIPKIAKFLMSNDKPKRKRSSGVMNGRRARMDEAEGSKRPNKVPRTERESTRRISLKTMPRKGTFEQLSFDDLQKICEKRDGKLVIENIKIEIENKDARLSEIDNKKDDNNSEGRITNSLRIDGLVRPFTKPQLQELLEKYGDVTYIWLDSIKTHCYVVFKNEEEAQACSKALDGLQWPEDSPKKLRVRYVSHDEAIEAARPKVRKEEPKKSEEDNKVHMKTLDELFRRTEAKPPLYWLPLTEEEIKERDRIRETRRPSEGRRPEGRR